MLYRTHTASWLLILISSFCVFVRLIQNIKTQFINKMQRYVMLQYVTHSYCWALEQKRHYNNDKKFAYFVKKHTNSFGYFDHYCKSGQLSHLLSEVFNTISNQIISYNRTYTNPSQSCLCLIPLFEKQEWHNDSKTIPHVVLSYDIMIRGAGKFLCSN